MDWIAQKVTEEFPAALDPSVLSGTVDRSFRGKESKGKSLKRWSPFLLMKENKMRANEMGRF